jgi:hypothetical protein
MKTQPGSQTKVSRRPSGAGVWVSISIPVGTTRTEIDALLTDALGPIGFASQESVSDSLTSPTTRTGGKMAAGSLPRATASMASAASVRAKAGSRPTRQCAALRCRAGASCRRRPYPRRRQDDDGEDRCTHRRQPNADSDLGSVHLGNARGNCRCQPAQAGRSQPHRENKGNSSLERVLAAICATSPGRCPVSRINFSAAASTGSTSASAFK